MVPRKFRAVSLFSNCGAGDVGYAKAGFQFEVMAELDPRRLAVCLLNHPAADGVPGDLRKTWIDVIAKYREKAGNERPALVAACPPCQGMSSARSGRGKGNDPDAGSRDKRNLLVTVVSSVVKELEPDLVVLENVPAFLTRKIRHPETGKGMAAASYLIDELSADYDVFPVLLDLCDFGVPQTRKRTFLTFVRRTVESLALLQKEQVTPYPRPTHAPDYNGMRVTLEKALKDFGLPSLDAKSPETATSKGWKGLHCVPVWQDHRYAMVAAIPPNSGGSAWENSECPKCGQVKVDEDSAECPMCKGPLCRPIVKQRNGRYRLVNGFRSSTYTRMRPKEPAATITTASGHVGSNNTLHPFENRLFSSLECARLQTFPATFNWGDALKKWGHTNVREMIGEAVPPMFTKKHGKVLIALLQGWMKLPLLPATDRRSRNAVRKLPTLCGREATKRKTQWPSSTEGTSFGRLNRSQLMARVRSADNATTELRFARLLREADITGWRRQYMLAGRPDFVWPKERLAVFIDGCFWHGHDCGRNLSPKKNASMWRDKILGNKRRDRRNSQLLRESGWSVIRVWECSLAKRPQLVISRLRRALADGSKAAISK